MFVISGTVRRFLEKFGEDIDLIVFAVIGNDRVFLLDFIFYFLLGFFLFSVLLFFINILIIFML